ncbi:hypothetical protein ANHYDRO_01053 [Anaerococcus hydrogenalis DSM 7454]|uniref:Uncharacterized protein n=1 Tax=Anaerococcus hydrogenalis DSM 7454 TaxID=561177 RepID=B6W902_9FIRM|nr:hypothetical protein [Anaerococcus hydrogenalis]EEB36107.1 hypothetical protein ANHYDRO_01053 [Anaerococcus hydrogenalis DSM 7454]
MDKELIDLGIRLGELAFVNTTSFVSTKIKSFKNEKDIQKLKNNYEEIINQLLDEKQEAIRIAQAYREEVENTNISDDKIDYLHNTVAKALKVLDSYSGDKEMEVTDIVKLIDKDVLKTMQLLGFNYKDAIGQPLTDLCKDYINSKSISNSYQNKEN